MTDQPGQTRNHRRAPGFAFKAPHLRAPHIPTPRAMGPGSVASLLKIALDVAHALLWLMAGVLTLAFITFVFVPLDNLTVVDGDRQLPLVRSVVLFGIGAFIAYFGAFILIVRNLRQMFRTLTQGDPFHPRNVTRLRQIGLVLATVTGGVFIVQSFVSRSLLGYVDRPSVGDLMTPLFAVLIVFVLAEVFREGARLRRESELTI